MYTIAKITFSIIRVDLGNVTGGVYGPLKSSTNASAWDYDYDLQITLSEQIPSFQPVKLICSQLNTALYIKLWALLHFRTALGLGLGLW